MEKIKLANQVIKYKIIRTNRKTLGIIIDHEGNLIVRSPKNTAEAKIEEVLKKKTNCCLLYTSPSPRD